MVRSTGVWSIELVPREATAHRQQVLECDGHPFFRAQVGVFRIEGQHRSRERADAYMPTDSAEEQPRHALTDRAHVVQHGRTEFHILGPWTPDRAIVAATIHLGHQLSVTHND